MVLDSHECVYTKVVMLNDHSQVGFEGFIVETVGGVEVWGPHGGSGFDGQGVQYDAE